MRVRKLLIGRQFTKILLSWLLLLLLLSICVWLLMIRLLLIPI